jgi:hypothetical protein
MALPSYAKSRRGRTWVGYADAGFSYEENPLEAEAFAVQGAYLNS